MRSFVLGSLLAGIVTTWSVVTADTSPPPTVPVSRDRPRLNHKKWSIRGKLYQPWEMADAAAADLLLYASLRSGLPIEEVIRLSTQDREKWLTLMPAELPFIRYLTTYNFPQQMRSPVYNATSSLINHLSNNDEVVRPAWGGPEGTLIRINLRDYHIDPKDWDKNAIKEPYFRVPVQRWVITTERVYSKETYLASDGKYYYKYQDVRAEKLKSEVAPTSWGPPGSMVTLVNLTQSQAPLIRADWWLVNFSQPPAYYDVLRLKTLEDFNDLVGFDKRALRKQIKATVVVSGSDGLCPRVTENNRILERLPSFQGYIWKTDDFLTSTGFQNVITRFYDADQDADAHEFIGSGPNGSQVYFLTNKQDKRIDEGDIKIVCDVMSGDFRVINGRSCIWCHADGINKFKSAFQLSVGPGDNQHNLGIFDKDPVKALKISEQIRRTFGSPDFDKYVEGDNRIFANFIRSANNMTPANNADLFRQLYNGYDRELLDMPRIVYEVGLSEQEILALLPLRVDGVSNAVLNQQLQVPPVAIRRDHWEEAWPTLMKVVLLRRSKP